MQKIDRVSHLTVSFNGHRFRVEPQGSIVRVTLPAVFVDEFFKGFPANLVPTARSYWFEFEWATKDLVDTNYPRKFDNYISSLLAAEAEKAL